jgi:hypothetical protein
MPLAQLPTIPADAPKFGEIHKHFKGKYALVVGTFIHSETGELLVGYDEADEPVPHQLTGPEFVRPLAMFTDTHPLGVKRFTKIDK